VFLQILHLRSLVHLLYVFSSLLDEHCVSRRTRCTSQQSQIANRSTRGLSHTRPHLCPAPCPRGGSWSVGPTDVDQQGRMRHAVLEPTIESLRPSFMDEESWRNLAASHLRVDLSLMIMAILQRRSKTMRQAWRWRLDRLLDTKI